MKKHLFFAVLLVAVAMIAAGTAMAGVGVIGTKHDMRGVTNATGTLGFSATDSEVCVYCHTPHSASTVITTLLWNKADASSQAYTPYASTSIDGTIDAVMGAQTRICLSCHDGSNSIFNMVNPPNSGGYVDGMSAAAGNISAGGMITGNPQLTADFSNDHPVSITYNVLDTGLANPVPAVFPMYAGKLECGSCHAVHDNTNAPFLRASNTASGMCRQCHTNK